MKLGIFFQPLHNPNRPVADCWDDDLNIIVHGDEAGFEEVWLGEHYCITWENLPAPELLIAKALGMTKKIRLGSGIHVLSYIHPAITAHKVAALDHLSRGRFMFGIGAGGTPPDAEMLGIDYVNNEHRERMPESIEMILALWASEGPVEMKGKYWDMKVPVPNKEMNWEYHLKPYQLPHPPIAVAGISPFSSTLKWGAERGYFPMSVDANVEIVKSHWIAIQQGAAKNGRVMPRSEWRVARVLYITETDEMAREHVLESSMSQGFEEHFMPLYNRFGGPAMIKHDFAVPDEAVDVNYAMENVWIVGSVNTVIKKLEKFYNDVGGFGTLLLLHFDTHPHPERYLNSMTLLKEQVLPRLKHLKPLPDTELLPAYLSAMKKPQKDKAARVASGM